MIMNIVVRVLSSLILVSALPERMTDELAIGDHSGNDSLAPGDSDYETNCTSDTVPPRSLSNDWFFGRAKGKFFRWKCHNGNNVQQININLDEENKVKSLNMQCADGETFNEFTADNNTLSIKGATINNLMVRTENGRIVGFADQGDTWLGQESGGSAGRAGGNGACPLRAIYGYAEDGKSVNGLGLVFQCEKQSMLLPTAMYGGSSGDLHQFLCPPRSAIKGFNARHGDAVYELQIICNDDKNTSSPVYGGAKDQGSYDYGYMARGNALTDVTVMFGNDMVYQILFDGVDFGDSAGHDDAQNDSIAGIDNCPAVGAWLRASAHGGIHAIGFTYDCEYAGESI